MSDELENLTREDIQIRMAILIDIKRNILKAVTLFCSIENLIVEEVKGGDLLAQIQNTQKMYLEKLHRLNKQNN